MSNLNSVEEIGEFLCAQECEYPDNETRKTKVWIVRSRKTGISLGAVVWQGGWRCYAFSAYQGTIINAHCARDLATWLDKVRNERRL